MELDRLFDKLWKQYSLENPSVGRIHNLFEANGEKILNDHIAFRTFNDPRLGIDVLARPLLERGYQVAGEYHFPDKKLYARHYELKGYPRVFISELLLEKFSAGIQAELRQLIDTLPVSLLTSDELLISGSIFGGISFKQYEKLRAVSEYAAWVYAFGFRANHFTISVNELKKTDTLQKLNSFLKENGFPLNASGGEIKGSPEQLLEQSSTLADKVIVNFSDGNYEIPSCYYEFARRYKDAKGKLFSGFIAGSADKIFESTDLHSKGK